MRCVCMTTKWLRKICYQCLPFLFDFKLGKVDLPPLYQSVAVVISPLLSLMIDQVTSLRHRGVQAAIRSGNVGMDGK